MLDWTSNFFNNSSQSITKLINRPLYKINGDVPPCPFGWKKKSPTAEAKLASDVIRKSSQTWVQSNPHNFGYKRGTVKPFYYVVAR